jgi:hypothetical protein
MDVLVNRWQRDDVHAALMGFGDSYDELVALATELHLEDYVTFTGRVGPAEIAQFLSTAHIGISPDPLSPLNDVSTMNKTMEYMSFALPVVAFDLAETRISGGDAVEYLPAAATVDDDVVEQFAVAVAKLLDDPERRADLGLAGRRRAETVLDWAPQRAAYLGVYDAITGQVSPEPVDEVLDEPLAEALGGALVDVSDDAVVRAFARDRCAPRPSAGAGAQRRTHAQVSSSRTVDGGRTQFAGPHFASGTRLRRIGGKGALRPPVRVSTTLTAAPELLRS